MLWHKEKYIVKIRGGRGQITTNPLHGLIQHLIIRPDTLKTTWSVKILDKERDAILELFDIRGRWDDFRGIPVGRDERQKLNVVFDEVTANEGITVIFKVREMQ